TRLQLLRDVARPGSRRDLPTLQVEKGLKQLAQIHRRQFTAVVMWHLPEHVLADGGGQFVVDRLAAGDGARDASARLRPSRAVQGGRWPRSHSRLARPHYIPASRQLTGWPSSF